MEVIVAKSAGFCFGVQNAINKALEAAKEGKNVYTYGPIIHNTGVVKELESKGIRVLNDTEDIKSGDVVIIRSHGISKSEYDVLLNKGADIIDSTCINVKNIHKIVEEKLKEGYKIIIIGDPQHPEVRGVNGWCNNEAIIISTESDLLNIQRDNEKICVVAQTTYNQEKWYQISCKLLQYAKETLVFNTICEATKLRQSEVLELSKNVDAMIVIGGKDSSNTKKLYEIAKENCELTIFIQDADELDLELIKGKEKVGVTGGASTPQNIINEIVNKISSLSTKNLNIEAKDSNKLEEDMNNESFYSDFIEIYPGCVLDGEVILVNDKELFLNIKYKSEALLTAQEDYGEDVSLKEKYKVGDIVSVEVIKTNDGEGNVLVSRRKLQRQEYLQKLDRMFNEKEPIDVVVDELNKGGYSCRYENIRAFMPLSLSGLYRSDDNNSLVGKKLTALINEIKKKKDEVELIVSRKEIVQEEKNKNVKEQLQNTEEGQIVSGKVKAIINTGVFVNVDNIDIFVPISEIVWRRINSPREVIKEENNVDVLIVKVDRENQKVLGSIKRSGIEPWDKFILNYKEGDIIDGTVARFTEYGAFVEIIDGVDGLLHISNISEARINKPQDVLKIGQKIRAKIIKIDGELKRVALSIKDME